jgi:Mn-dependent DtxR family transcriptional regulator
MPAELTEFEERLLKYLYRRKTASTVKQMSKFFIRSESYVYSALRKLEESQLITVIQSGSTKLYAYKD